MSRLSSVLPALAVESRPAGNVTREGCRDRPAALALACCVLACCLPGCGGTPAPPPAARPPVALVCPFTEVPIVVDGRLDDAAWQDALDVAGFSLPWLGAAARPAEQATRAKLLWDREFLYVAADMDDADLYADITEHDGNTWENDVFEVFLKPSATEPAYYEFHVTPLNTQFDVFLPRRGHVSRFKRLHEFGIESAVQLRGTLDDCTDRDQGWTVEMRIPWASLAPTGGRPEPGDEWWFALCRYDFDVGREDPELSTCAPLAKLNFHRHEDYRPLVFAGPRADAARPYGIPTIVPVTTSRVAGSPEPPLPYRVERTHPLARPSGLITVAHQPGSDRLLYATEPGPYAASTLMRMRDDEAAHEAEVLIPADDTTIHYAITFHPRFSENGYVFIGSNGVRSPDGRVPEDGRRRTRITRYRIDREPPYTFHADSATVIIEWDSGGHDGGDVAFGPDGMLYVGSGDGSTDSDTDRAGQDLTTLRSKILRIDADHPDEEVPNDGRHYAVPEDNPIFDAGSPLATVEGARPETWAYGLRQPWRLAFDARGRLWVANQGQDLWEQIYLIERGANYGWSVMEGSHPFRTDQEPGPTPFSTPLIEHSHAEARSITGGLVYTGSALPDLRGAYLYGDYATGRIWSVRHDGASVTRHELVADTPLNITGFGTDSRGELLICDHQPGENGGFYRLVATPPAPADRPPFPRTLSESGLFVDVSRHTMAPGVVPYEPASPLWSDATHKARFFALPPRTDAAGRTVPSMIGVTDARGWHFPDGTVLVKSFALDRIEGDPSSRRWIETRFMLKEQGEWSGYSYEWNDDQTDAVLVAAEGKDREFEIATAGPAPGVKHQQWRYPSRTECMVCHSRASNYVLGLCTVQLNRDYDYAAVLGGNHATDNQLRALEHAGLLAVPMVGGKTSPMLARSPATTNRLVNPADPAELLEARARSYLQANCASCHVYAGGGNAQIDLEYVTATETKGLDAMNAIGIKPLHATFDLPDARLIAAGDPERSVLLARMSRRGPGQMPQLATTVVDEQAVALLRQWIESLAPPPATVSAR